MPVWPFLILISAGLTFWGWRNNAWEVPALALAGYIGMRGVIAYVPTDYIEVAGCALWLLISAAMICLGGAVAGFFYALSALTYPVLLVFGYRIDYMGLSPIVAEIFAACALLSIGGGIYGVANSSSDLHRPMDGFQGHSMGMAAHKKMRSVDL